MGTTDFLLSTDEPWVKQTMENATTEQAPACNSAEERVILLGSYVKDTTTGLVGKAIARSIHLNRCLQYHILPLELNDKGEMYNEHPTDIQNVELLAESELPSGKTQPEMENIATVDEDEYLGAVVRHLDSNYQGMVVIIIERLHELPPLLVVDGKWTNGKIPREVVSVTQVEIVEEPKLRPANIQPSRISHTRAKERVEKAQTGCYDLSGVSTSGI